MVRIEKATYKHIEILEARQADIDEVYSASGLDIKEALKVSLNMEGYHFAGFINNELVCIFGVGGLYNFGIPYMIGSDKIVKYKKTFLTHSMGFIDKMKKQYSYMTNFVDSRNVVAIEWLKWLGFTIYEAEPYGYLGLPFHKFDMRCDNV